MLIRDLHAILDLPDEAKEVDIRRAYARKLKLVRPDEDPESFQRLVQARDIALAWARDRERGKARETGAPEELNPIDPIVVRPQPASARAPDVRASQVTEPNPQSISAVASPEVSAAIENQDVAQAAAGDAPAGALESGSSPHEVLEALRSGLAAITERSQPFDLHGFDAMLLKLPVGGADTIQEEVIREMAQALVQLRSKPHLEAAVVSFEQLGVLLARLFDWYANDRKLHSVLNAEDVARFETFLGSAHEQHASGNEKRFARTMRVHIHADRSSLSSRIFLMVWIIFVSASAGLWIFGSEPNIKNSLRRLDLQSLIDQDEEIKRIAIPDVDRFYPVLLSKYRDRVEKGEALPAWPIERSMFTPVSVFDGTLGC